MALRRAASASRHPAEPVRGHEGAVDLSQDAAPAEQSPEVAPVAPVVQSGPGAPGDHVAPVGERGSVGAATPAARPATGREPAAGARATSPRAAGRAEAGERTVVLGKQERAAAVAGPAGERGSDSAADQNGLAEQPLDGTAGSRGERRRRLRDKKDVNLTWAVDDEREIVRTFKRLRRIYQEVRQARGLPGPHRLTQSNLTAAALNRALDEPAAWLGEVRNSRRGGQVRVPLVSVGLLWPTSLVDRLTYAWWDLDAEGVWPAKFTLTKSNLAAAGILHALRSVEEWLVEVPNDDRFTAPAAGDLRLLRGADRVAREREQMTAGDLSASG